MIIDFENIAEQELVNFKGGEKSYNKKGFEDENNKIMLGRLVPGASIGLHTHEGTSETIFILRGEGKVLYDGNFENIKAGQCHYCPMDHEHSLINDSDSELVFYAVVPKHDLKNKEVRTPVLAFFCGDR